MDTPIRLQYVRARLRNRPPFPVRTAAGSRVRSPPTPDSGLHHSGRHDRYTPARYPDRGPFTWRGYVFPKHSWVLLDLYGTDHDPRSWPEPGSFSPERFVVGEPTAYDLVPQGADPTGRDTGSRVSDRRSRRWRPWCAC